MKELLERNAAYKKSLEYCEETCDMVDWYYNELIEVLEDSNEYSLEQLKFLKQSLVNLNDKVKDQGTRKLRKAFVDYILEGSQWNKISEVGVPKQFKNVFYRHSCGSMYVGKVILNDKNEVRALSVDNKPIPHYGYPIIAWLEVPEYK